jgi:hemerythrin-like metal-binding protein
MVLDLIPVSGVVLSTVILLCGACLVSMESGPFLHSFGRKSSSPLHLSAKDLRLIGRLDGSGPDGHSLSSDVVMDTQHQCLSDDANDLRAAILSGRTVADVDTTINTLIRDVVGHFRDEEAILTEIGYPGTAEHAALHRQLVNAAATLAGRFHAGALEIGELFQFLAHDVLAKHMLGADGELIPYLEGRR